MPIGIVFSFGTEVIEVVVRDLSILFRTTNSQAFATIDGLKLDKSGAIKEFPDLKDRDDWKEEVIKRFKEKIKNMRTENERAKYIIEDLTKYGYKALYYQRAGSRVIKLT